MPPKPTRKLKQTALTNFLSPVASSSSPAAGPSRTPTKKISPKKQIQITPNGKLMESDGSPDPSDVEAIPFEALPAKGKAKGKRVLISSDEDSEIVEITKPIAPPSPLSDPEEEEVGPSPRRKHFGLLPKHTQAPKRTRNRLPSTPPSSRGSSPLSNASSEHLDRLPVPKRANQGKSKLIVDSEDENAGEGAVPRKKRKLRNVDETALELEELAEEIDPELVVDTRLRGAPKQSKFSQNLERLKRKRQGKSSPTPAPPEEDEDEEEEGEEDDDDAPIIPFKGARPGIIDLSSDRENEDEEVEDAENEDDFIVEDDPSAPSLELPDEFSMTSRQDMSHLFKITCQLFVHLIVSAVDDRSKREALLDDGYFRAPLTALRRTLSSTRDSLVASSIWRPDFRQALEDHPKLSTSRLEESMMGCDACHMSSRISTICAHVKGKKWPGLLGPEDDDEDEESEDEKDEDEESQDDKDEDEESEEEKDEDEDDEGTISFNLGRSCATRTRVYHNYSHWEYVLYHALKEQIDTLQPRGRDDNPVPRRMFVQVDTPYDIENADAVMEWLDKKSVIAFEWSRLKEMTESAQGLDRVQPDDDVIG